jgi:fumarate hydratase, class II
MARALARVASQPLANQARRMSETRIEQDSLGDVEVSDARLWGAQTQRSFDNFRISDERMPGDVIIALAHIKRAAALANHDLGLLPQPLADAIARAAGEVIAGLHDEEFPLRVWQTGSGTQSHMNVNEVLANRASELLGGERGTRRRVHANDHVNLGQSSNDVFSAAMNMAALLALRNRTLPRIKSLRACLEQHALTFDHIIKIGRTHLQDATPLTLGQEFSGWASQIAHAEHHLEQSFEHLSELAIGGTAVGTGLNTHPEFAQRVCQRLTAELGVQFLPSPNKFEALSAHDAIVFAHGALKTLAAALLKIANDVRWLASGPRAGIGELLIPSNEPGSSIMPGKVNPTQSEALMMCCMQVFGNDVAVNLAGSSGNFQLNVCKPLLAHNFLQSARLLADGASSFHLHLVRGIEPNLAQIARHLDESLMLVTALTPHLGYDRAAVIAKLAHQTGKSLREAAIESGFVTNEEFTAWVRPERMLAARTDSQP